MTVAVDLGTTQTGEPAELDLEELLSTRLLVQGNSGSGKSHLLRRLLERSAGWVQQAVIDPEGDFRHARRKTRPRRRRRQSHAGRTDPHRTADSRAPRLGRPRSGRPRRGSADAVLGGLPQRAVRGRSRPLVPDADRRRRGASVRARHVRRAVGGGAKGLARGDDQSDVPRSQARARRRHRHPAPCQARQERRRRGVEFPDGGAPSSTSTWRGPPISSAWTGRAAERFRDLETGNFVALGPALSKRPMPIRIGPVETAGRSGRPALIPLPELATEAMEDLIFTVSEADRQAERRQGSRPQPAQVRAEPSPAATRELMERVASTGSPAEREALQDDDPRTAEERAAPPSTRSSPRCSRTRTPRSGRCPSSIRTSSPIAGSSACAAPRPT